MHLNDCCSGSINFLLRDLAVPVVSSRLTMTEAVITTGGSELYMVDDCGKSVQSFKATQPQCQRPKQTDSQVIISSGKPDRLSLLVRRPENPPVQLLTEDPHLCPLHAEGQPG